MYTTNLFESFSPGIFIGRDEELNKLEKLLIHDKEKVVTISGNNATGKTALWMEFLKRHKANYDERVQVLRTSSPFRNLPEIDKKISLVVIEDISFDFNLEIEKRLIELIKRNFDKQFLLVGAHADKLKMSSVNNIHLQYFAENSSDELLNKLLKSKISPKEIQKIANLTKGNPYLLGLFSSLLNEKNIVSIKFTN
ncbi:MAG: hypothetical protein M0D53_08800 [Flavobacterium sp. JAD_PAG50586_2]|nr:MAG: hypothetical protein M0D53_08800 [Flavobacterium sp. JAD_PAG50586_2]